MDQLPDIQKIAVLRAIGLGDFIAATPALQALRDTYPDAEIVYLGKPWHKTFLDGRPGPVDRTIVVPVSHGVREEPFRPDLREDRAELDAFFAEMQQEKFDLGIQMHGGGRNSNPFLLRLGASFKVGMCTPDAPRLDRWMPYVFYQSEYWRLLELVRLVGAQACELQPVVNVTEKDHAEVRAQLPDLQSPFVVMHPGATDAYRRWPADRFAQVGDALAQQGFQVIVSGANDEGSVVQRVIGAMQFPAIGAFGCLSVGGLAALLSRAALVIANDTGPMHLANAVGTRNIAIFWIVNYPNWSFLGRSKHRPLISWAVRCPLCGMDLIDPSRLSGACTHDFCRVAGVAVGEVLAAAADLLAYPDFG